jgi:hypothetical protein
MKEWHFQEKVYKRWVVLLIGPWDELLSELRKVNYRYVDELELAAGMNIRLNPENSDENYTLIWMPKWTTAVLVHELSHLAMATFDRASVSISFENEEAFAFYLEYWFSEICRVYKRYPNGRTATQTKAST